MVSMHVWDFPLEYIIKLYHMRTTSISEFERSGLLVQIAAKLQNCKMADSVAEQNGFIPVTVWIHDDHCSAVATRKFEYLTEVKYLTNAVVQMCSP